MTRIRVNGTTQQLEPEDAWKLVKQHLQQPTPKDTPVLSPYAALTELVAARAAHVANLKEPTATAAAHIATRDRLIAAWESAEKTLATSPQRIGCPAPDDCSCPGYERGAP